MFITTLNKLHYLDSLRGLACMMVVFSHLSLVFFPYLHNFSNEIIPDSNGIQYLIHNSPFAFLFSGTSAVYIFFVLSGIVLSRSVEKKDFFGYVNSFISRYPRLMIPALFSCLIAYVVFKYVIDSWGVDLTPWFSSLYIEPSLLDAIYNGAIKPFFVYGSSYNSVLWTMQIELFGSFLIYIFSFTAKKIDVRLNSILFFLVALASYFISSKLALGFMCFWFGYILYTFNIKIKFKVNLTSWLLLLVGLYLAGAHSGSYSYGFIASFLGSKTYEICNLLSSFIIVFAIYSNEYIQNLLNKKSLIKLGKRSFSIYLIHLTVIVLVCYFVYQPLLAYFSYEFTAITLSLLIVFLTIVLSQPMSYVDDFAVKISKLCCVFNNKRLDVKVMN